MANYVSIYKGDEIDAALAAVPNKVDKDELDIRLGTTGNLGNAATRTITIDNSDTTSGRLLQVGAQGTQLGQDVYRRANIIGTVSQSGGVPTGAIIESGSNANGEYIRYASGIQICRVRTEYDNPLGSTWTYPATFTNIPSVTSGQVGGLANSLLVSMNVPTSSSVNYAVIVSTTAAALSSNSRVDFIAIGSWY